MDIDKKTELSGGRAGLIHKQGGTVLRPAHPWTADVHRFLRYLREAGADFAPIPYGVNEHNEEILSYLTGEVYNYPLPAVMQTGEALASAARLLRALHDYGTAYLKQLNGTEKWMLPAVNPVETMCHGDFAPYNVTVINGAVTGVIDFDTLHPGPRMWDVAYAIYRFADGTQEVTQKARLFMDAYGIPCDERGAFAPMLVKRLRALTAYMKEQADAGEENFIQNIGDGHLAQYEADIRYWENGTH